MVVLIFGQPVNFDGGEELLNGGETRDKLSLVFSLFPPSTDSSEGYSLRDLRESSQWFWGQLTGRVSVGVTIRVGLRPFDATNWLRGWKKLPPTLKTMVFTVSERWLYLYYFHAYISLVKYIVYIKIWVYYLLYSFEYCVKKHKRLII